MELLRTMGNRIQEFLGKQLCKMGVHSDVHYYMSYGHYVRCWRCGREYEEEEKKEEF